MTEARLTQLNFSWCWRIYFYAFSFFV